MPIKRTANYDEANSLLAQINVELAQAGRQNLMSGHVHAEEIFAGILNLSFGYNLVNANSTRHNAPGIDLIDENSKVAVQVTSDWSSEKMKSTLASPAIEKLANEGYTIKFCYIGEQKDCTKKRNPKNPYGIRFHAKEDVILTADILNSFAHKDVDGQEEIVSLLRKETGKGILLTAELLQDRLQAAVKDLGPRYTPEANVRTPDMAAFDALAASPAFMRKFEACCRSLGSRIRRFIELDFASPEARKAAEAAAELIAPLWNSLNEGRDQHDVTGWCAWAFGIYESAADCSTFPPHLLGGEDAVKNVAKEYADVRHYHHELLALCRESRTDLLGGGAVIVIGEAGIGKSHLLADTAERCLQLDGASVLILGQWFRDPLGTLDAIPHSLGLACGIDDFLDEASRYSSVRNRPGLIFIDALNEGAGRVFWKNELPQLVDKVKSRSNLRLILSVRATYADDVLPHALTDLGRIECSGFEEAPEAATKAFCEHYGIDHPAFPLVGEEFANPLHLRLLCEHLARGGSTAFAPSVSLGAVVQSHLDGINEKLSSELHYDQHVNLVEEIVRKIVVCADFSYGSIDYTSAVRIASKVAGPFVAQPGNFIGHLVSEGLFNAFERKGQKYLVFSYELVGNFITALRIAYSAAKQAGASNGIQDKERALAWILDNDCSWAASDQGAIAALSAIVPEQLGFELYEAVPTSSDRGNVVAISFVDSLGWREGVDLTPSLERFIDDEVFGYEDTLQAMVDKVFQLAARPGFETLCEHIRSIFLDMKMPLRDYAWSSRIARGRSALRLADWAWSHADSVDPRCAPEIAKTLALSLGTVNLELRLAATKALARLMVGKPELAMSLYENYSDVDDDYMLESLHAAIYGAMANSEPSKLDEWAGVAEAVRRTVFGSESDYPNVIVRDYARLIVELAADGGTDPIDANPIKPPYRSEWYDSLPNNEDIDGIVDRVAEEYGRQSDEFVAVDTIVRSMTTEYGRGAGMYGDYGRYIFGLAVRDWNNQFDDQDLSNAVTAEVLEKWYAPGLHAKFDKMLGWYEGRFAPGCERIGKKYQKIGTHRLVARLLDSYPPYSIERDHREGYEEALRLSVERHWRAFEEGRYDEIDDDFAEEDWITDERRVPYEDNQLTRIVMSQRYTDPTMVWRRDELACPLRVFSDILNIGEESQAWIRSDAQRQSLDGFRLIRWEGNEMYLLAAEKRWKHAIGGLRHREATWITGARLAESDKAAGFSEEDSEIRNGGGIADRYPDVFLGEIYKGYGYSAIESLYNAEQDITEASSKAIAHEYHWDEERSEAEPHALFAPARKLVERFGLNRRGGKSWQDAEGNVIAANLFDSEGNCIALLFDAISMNAYLKETGLELYWDEYLEKQTRTKLYRCWQLARYANGAAVTNISDECTVDKNTKFASEDDWID